MIKCKNVKITSNSRLSFQQNLNKQDQKQTERFFGETQYGFRPGNHTCYLIARRIIEKAQERNIPLYFHFIDFKAAFDIIWREAL